MTTPRQTIRILILGAWFIVWVSASWVIAYRPDDRLIAAIVGAILTVGLYLTYWRIAINVYTATVPSSGVKPRVDPTEVTSAINKLYSKISRHQAFYYAQMVLDPAQYVQRIGETITPATRSYRVTTSYSLTIPPSLRNSPVVIPLFLARKRTLLSRFSVEGASGDRYSTLSQDDAVAHTGAVLRALIETCGTSILNRYKVSVETKVIAFLCRPEPVPSIDGDYVELKSLINSLATGHLRQLDIVIRVLRSFKNQYPVVIIESADLFDKAADHTNGHARLRIKATRQAIPHLKVKGSRGDRIRDMARLNLGVRPSLICWPISNSLRARSYHLETSGPEGTYLARQAIINSTDSRDSTPMSGIQYIMQPRYWQRFSHLYVHGRREQPPRPLAYVAKFYERAPGSIASAALSAFAALFLVGIAAVGRTTLRLDVGSDLVAVLLAVPAIAGAWAGFGSGTLFGGSLNSRLSLIATMVLSLFAAGFYILGPRPENDADFNAYWLDRAGASLWTMLVLLALLNFVATAASWGLRASVQRHFTDRDGEDA